MKYVLNKVEFEGRLISSFSNAGYLTLKLEILVNDVPQEVTAQTTKYEVVKKFYDQKMYEVMMKNDSRILVIGRLSTTDSTSLYVEILDIYEVIYLKIQ